MAIVASFCDLPLTQDSGVGTLVGDFACTAIIGGDCTFTLTERVEADPSLIELTKFKKKKAIMVQGKVSYMDAFKEPQEMEFTLLSKNLPDGGWVLQPTKAGNWST